MHRITGTIITFNEEPRIAEAIASLACCDEVIVVDSGSTDRTREIAQSMGAKVIEQQWLGYAKQKNFAADASSNDWILNIDADERISVELSRELVQWTKSQEEKNGSQKYAWSMPRRTFYLGRWIKHSGWYPDSKVRLYNRQHCRFEGDYVHESIGVKGDAGRFEGDLLHLPYRTWADHWKTIDRYTELAAQSARSRGVHGNVVKLIAGPPAAFLKAFFFRAGFLDGWRGLAIAYMGARYVFQREFRILR